jgi:hypothetical protein
LAEPALMLCEGLRARRSSVSALSYCVAKQQRSRSAKCLLGRDGRATSKRTRGTRAHRIDTASRAIVPRRASSPQAAAALLLSYGSSHDGGGIASGVTEPCVGAAAHDSFQQLTVTDADDWIGDIWMAPVPLPHSGPHDRLRLAPSARPRPEMATSRLLVTGGAGPCIRSGWGYPS